jgi:UDP-N-acetylmuramate dehydrogenase
MKYISKRHGQELKRLCRDNGGDIMFDVDLSEKNTIRVGGRGFAWYEPDTIESLVAVLGYLESNGISWKVIGAGSNVLFPEKMSGEVYISLRGKNFSGINIEGNMIHAGAGTLLSSLVSVSAGHGLSGFESLVGIPGSVGGAIKTNASYKNTISDILEKVLVLDGQERVKWVEKQYIRFEYRKCILPQDGIILEALFRLTEDASEKIKSLIRENFMLKMEKQPLARKTLGCTFKNPRQTGLSAGQLIDRAGLKGYASGDAIVSDKHANFIINSGKATVKNVKDVINTVLSNVEEEFGVCLEPEIEVL